MMTSIQTTPKTTSRRRAPQARPEQRPYTAYGAAAAMWRDRSEEIVLEGPAGTGKTRAILEKMHYCAIKYAGMRVLMARKTRESLTQSILVTFEEKVLPAGSSIAAGPSRENRQVYRYPNGSEIVVSGLVAHGRDQKARVMSTEYDLILIFEATELSEHEYEQLSTRLRNGVMPYQQLIADCNPDQPQHWLHQRCDRGAAQVYFSRHEDNAALYDHKQRQWTEYGLMYIGRLDRLTGIRYLRLRLGKRATAEGTVYEFDRAIHLVDRFEIPSHWRRFRVIDFGFNNPFVCLWFAINDDGDLIRYRELYVTQKTVQELAPEIIKLSTNERIEATICDHDAEDRATLSRAGIPNVPAKKAIGRGIQAMQERLKIGRNGKPRIYYMRDSLVSRDESLVEAGKPYSTEQEFDSYVWPKGVDGKPLKEIPVDVDNHGMDGSRYMVMHIDAGAGVQVFV